MALPIFAAVVGYAQPCVIWQEFFFKVLLFANFLFKELIEVWCL